MASYVRQLATSAGKGYRSSLPQIPKTSSILSQIPSKSQIRSVFRRTFCTTEETRAQKLERIADELLHLNKIEYNQYAALLRQKMGLKPWGSAVPGGGASSDHSDAKEKTAFDVKLVNFNLVTKFEVMKKIMEFTYLSIEEAEDLLEKMPAVVKMGVTKEEADKIVKKLKEVGATVVLV